MDLPPDVIASAAESRQPVDRTRNLLVVATVVLAAATAVSAMLAIHFQHQASRLQAHHPAETPLAPIAVPSVATTPAAVSAPPIVVPALSAPPLAMRAFDLDMPRPHTTVYLAAAAADGVGFTDGQLVVTALIRGGQPGARYRLTGGDCDSGQQPANVDRVWAQGIADAAGTAFLTGPDWTLPKADQYYLVLETLPVGATTSVTGSGVQGVFLLSGLLSPIHPGHSPCL